MPWEKTFEIDTAIDRATEVFWAKGYEATSLADLLNAIGINKGSFYNAFGSKKNIFIQSLLKYEREQRRDALRDLEKLNNPVKAIRTFFETLVEQSQTDEEKKGCFLVNTALDLPNHDADIAAAVQKGLNDTEAFFTQQITRGVEQGDIPAHINIDQAAKGLLGILVGLRVLSRGVYDRSSLQALQQQAMSMIQ